jgi:outer membrane protein TolC
MSAHRKRSALTITSLALAVTLFSHPVVAEGLSLTQAESLAIERDPGQDAFEARAQAMVERAVAAAQWPDPQMRFGFSNLPVDSFALSQEPMTQSIIGFRQPIPSGALLSAREEGMQAMARSLEARGGDRERRVQRTVRELWLEIAYWTETQRTIDETVVLFTQLLDVTRSLYAVGRQNQQDVIRAELELDRLRERSLRAAQRTDELRAALTEWLGPQADSVLDLRLPSWGNVPERGQLLADLELHPLMSAFDARLDAADAGIAAADARYSPNWAVDLQYGLRRGQNLDGSARSDFTSLMVSLDVPLFTRNRQDRERDAAASDQVAAHADRVDIARQLTAQLDTSLAAWHRTEARLALYDQSLIRESVLQADAALNAYQTDVGDFADVMRAYITVLNTSLERLRLAVDLRRAWAALDYLGDLDHA